MRLGDATYSVYLFHWLIGWIFAKILDRVSNDVLPPAIYFTAMVTLMLAGGYLVHALLERPIMALSRQIWRDAAGSEERWPLTMAIGRGLRQVATLRPSAWLRLIRAAQPK